jgi:ubiquitin-protein ligase E3 C
VFSAFCDTFAHHLLAVNDDDFLERYHRLSSNGLSQKLPGQKNLIDAKDVVVVLRKTLNDLYWVRPVLASDITVAHNDAGSSLRFERARLLLSGTKLWNSLYERWCRLYRVVQFCDESSWWFPHLASRGQHDSNPIIQSQTTTVGDQGVNNMDDGSDGSTSDDEMDDAAPISSGDAGGDALASTFRDPKMARVLTYIPQAMPFSRRVNLFNALLESDKLRTQDESMSLSQMMRNFEDDEEPELSGRERITIRRDSLYLDSKRRLNSLGKRLRKRIQVTFVNKLGQQEAGIDGGGVFKEFLDDLIKDAFLPQTTREENDSDEDSVPSIHPDFFSVTPLQTLKVNTMLDGNSAILSHYEFLGRVLGKAIYESILVEPQFCLPFLNKVLGKQNSLDDLKNLDPEYYKNLKSLRHMSAKEINGLGLTFELHDSTSTTIELMPGGSSIPVTRENAIQYIHLVSHQKMNVRGSHQTAAFLRGFRDIIPAQWVRLFSAYELQKLISGDDAVKGIDVKGMMSVMRYSGGFHPSQSIVQWLWEVVDDMAPDQQRKFLRFMTSCSRQPLLGFSSMAPAPCIQQIRLREDHQGNDVAEGLDTGNIRLPTSSTCMNLLKLPKYTSKEMLREKLLYAIESASGFELS